MNEWRSVFRKIEARLGLPRGAAQEYLRILPIVPDQPEARRELAPAGASK